MRGVVDAERETFLLRLIRRCVDFGDGAADEIENDRSSKPERRKHEPRQNEGSHVVQHLEDEEELADRVVAGLEHAAEVDQRVDGGGERTVEPATTLGDEFRRAFGNIGLALGGFDVRQVPLGAGFGNQFEARGYDPRPRTCSS